MKQPHAPFGVAILALVLGASCRGHGESAVVPRESSSTSSSAAARPEDAGTLPEDPEAGARSTAEWRRHLEHEELERRLGYDRQRLEQHRAVLQRLATARGSYDAARSDRAVLAAKRAFQALKPELEQRFDAIDHHGVSSKVLPDYREIVASLAEPYPAACLAALAGDSSELTRVRAALDARLRGIDAWLRAAAESEDE